MNKNQLMIVLMYVITKAIGLINLDVAPQAFID
jgi:hypothetical protein